MSTLDHPAIQQELAALLDKQKSLQLATLASEDHPAISAAPFLWDEGNFYIFVSALAAHTQHLRTQPRCSVLIIEDEVQAKNIFARKRAMFDCTAVPIERNSPEALKTLEDMQSRLGDTIEELKGLPDFTLFRLSATQASYVRGFGAAFDVEAQTLTVLSQRTGR